MERLRGFAVALMAVSLCFAFSDSALADVVLQSDSRERFGDKDFAYFFIEAEDFHDNDPRLLGAASIVSSDPSALATTVNDPAEPDPGAFASGDESITNALFDNTVSNETGGGHDVQYILEFDTPGTYYLYIRQHSPLGPENDRNKNDSFYVPVEFGEDPRQLKANGDDYGILESIASEGDTFQRGPWLWFAARHTVENSEQSPLSEQNPAMFQEYVITEDMVGEELILEFDHRENGCMLDAFLFIEVTSGLPPTSGLGPDGLGFYGPGDEVDEEFGLENYDPAVVCLAPEMTDISPTEGTAGDEVTITGTSLACAAGVEVTVCDMQAAIIEVTDTSITVEVPACAAAGPVDVTVSHVGFESATMVGGFTYSEDQGLLFKRGDCNGNGAVEGITDSIALLGYNFLGNTKPPCLAACDLNGDASLGGVTDAVYLLTHSFLGGPPPPEPYLDCGPLTAGDEILGCETGPAGCQQ